MRSLETKEIQVVNGGDAASGAANGAVQGAAIGASIAGGPGAIAGAVIGAAAGAIRGSVGTPGKSGNNNEPGQGGDRAPESK